MKQDMYTGIGLGIVIFSVFAGFWTKWIAKKGKRTVEARTAHKALTEILKIK